MPRHARVIPLEGYMHIISRGNNRRKILRYPQDKRRYLLYLDKLKREERIDICHYCIMSNHVHLIVGLKKESRLSRFMKRVNLKYVYYYRKRHTYFGHLWQDRFKGKIIDNDSYLIQCGKYIELNPVRAGIVLVAEDYIFSSYNYYAFGQTDELITEDPLYKDLGNMQEKRQLCYRNMMIEENKIISFHNYLCYNK